MDANNPHITYPESLVDVVRIVYKWRKRILVFILAITALTAVISFFLPNYYRSMTKFYPANDEAFSAAALYGQGEAQSDVGEVEMVERVINYATSRDLVDYMVHRFGLYEHYNIDSTNIRGEEKVRLAFLDHYDVKKDEYGAIELSIEDTDPSYPLMMVQAALKKLDQLYSKAMRSNKERTMKAYESVLNDRRRKQLWIVDTLRLLRTQYGILDADEQGGVLSEMVIKGESDLAQVGANLEALRGKPGITADTLILLEARVKGLTERVRQLTDPNSKSGFNTTRFNEGRQLVKYYEYMQDNISYEVRELTEKYQQYRTAAILNPSVVIMTEAPQTPKIKYRPKRSIIILGASIISFIIALFGALLIESYRSVEWSKILKD